MIPSMNASSSARSRRPRADAGEAGAAAGVSLRGFGVSGRIDVGCAVSDVASKKNAAREILFVIIGSEGGTREGGLPWQYVRGASPARSVLADRENLVASASISPTLVVYRSTLRGQRMPKAAGAPVAFERSEERR